MPALTKLTFTIPNGASVSQEVDVRAWQVVAIQMPAAWTAANLTFKSRQGNADGATGVSQSVYDDGGTELSVTAAVDRYIAITGAKLDALTAVAFLVIRSGTAGAAVNQGAARDLVVLVAPRAS